MTQTTASISQIAARLKARQVPVHFYPRTAMGSGSIERDWEEHVAQALLTGCDKCGILPGDASALYEEPEHPLHVTPSVDQQGLSYVIGAMVERCMTSQVPVHFYPRTAMGSGSIERDWEEHVAQALLNGCDKCGIQPGVGSHALTSLLMPTPPTLDTRGNNYNLPVFARADAGLFKGKRVLFLSADGPELPEIMVPKLFLQERGAEVVIAGQDWIFEYRNPAGYIVIAQWLAPAFCLRADVRLSDVRVEDFDMVFVAGGAWNPDMLRTDNSALSIVRSAHVHGIPVVSICHGPQVLINAAFDAPEGQVNFPAAGVHVTGTTSIRRDLINAGFLVHTEDAVVYDEGAKLLTGRDPNDLGPLCEAMAALLQS